MMFTVTQPAVWTVLGLALLAIATLLVFEWRRLDGRRRPARFGATVLAVGALALWALRPAWHDNGRAGDPGEITAALWTAAARAIPAPAEVAPRYRFALPGANVPAGAGATFLPDAATWRRRFPEVGRLCILGDGLDPADLPALAGLWVEFVPGARTATAADEPSLLSLRCPRVLPLGETLTIEGRVGGLPVGKSCALTLETPDGAAIETATIAANADGEAGFTVRAPSPSAAGRFLWHLRLHPGTDEALGVEVRAPSLPRVLVLESAPRFDAADLRHWYEEADGTLRARVRLGQDRYRFFAAGGGTPPGFDALDAPLLAGFDLVLADARALASLPAPERAVLRTAVVDNGLGVLAMADDAVLPPATVAADRAWLFPWQLRPLDAADNAASGTEHLARVFWSGRAQPAEIPLPTAPFEIIPRAGQTDLVHDDQGRALAAAAALGRGTLALTLVRETGRWQRANAPEAFAGYWSSLFSQTARRLEAAGRWTLAGGDDGPVFVDQPLELRWTGARPGEIHAMDESGAGPVALPPGSDPVEPGRWRVTFWPRRAGWHRVESNGAGLDFYVHPAGSWAALAAERRRTATERFAAQAVAAPVRRAPAEPTPVPAGWWFGTFLAGAGFLWIERRWARG